MKSEDINNSYRKDDTERWQEQGFVVGIRIFRSKSSKHPCELCEHMNGVYPKSFLFQGWHDECISFIVPEMLEGEDFTQFLLTGNTPQEKIIAKPPAKAINYIKQNYERLKDYYWADELLKY